MTFKSMKGSSARGILVSNIKLQQTGFLSKNSVFPWRAGVDPGLSRLNIIQSKTKVLLQ